MPVARTSTVSSFLLTFLLVQRRVHERISSMTRSFICYAILILISLAMRTSSRTVESADLNSVQAPLFVAHSYPNMDNSDDSEDRICHIEYQVTRKRTGQCMKLGHGITGCVSGNYMNPFHPDCF